MDATCSNIVTFVGWINLVWFSRQPQWNWLYITFWRVIAVLGVTRWTAGIHLTGATAHSISILTECQANKIVNSLKTESVLICLYSTWNNLRMQAKQTHRSTANKGLRSRATPFERFSVSRQINPFRKSRNNVIYIDSAAELLCGYWRAQRKNHRDVSPIMQSDFGWLIYVEAAEENEVTVTHTASSVCSICLFFWRSRRMFVQETDNPNVGMITFIAKCSQQFVNTIPVIALSVSIFDKKKVYWKGTASKKVSLACTGLSTLSQPDVD